MLNGHIDRLFMALSDVLSEGAVVIVDFVAALMIALILGALLLLLNYYGHVQKQNEFKVLKGHQNSESSQNPLFLLLLHTSLSWMASCCFKLEPDAKVLSHFSHT